MAPRPSYLRLEHSRSIPRLDDKNTWSIVCLYLAKEARRQDLLVEFIQAAVDSARAGGAEAVESYPFDPLTDAGGNWQPARSYRFMGYTSSYLRAGFEDVTPEGAARRILASSSLVDRRLGVIRGSKATEAISLPGQEIASSAFGPPRSNREKLGTWIISGQFREGIEK